MTRKKMKKNPKASPPESPESTLVQFTKEFERLTKEIAEIEKHSDNERTLAVEAEKIYAAVIGRTSEVLTMNNRTLRERHVQLSNIKEQLSQLTR